MIKILQQTDAAAFIYDKNSRNNWQTLKANCPWATSFQSWEFAVSWYQAYEEKVTPLIILEQDDASQLIGLFALAQDKQSNTIMIAGDYQAEYKTWLASPDNSDNFIRHAIQAIQELNPQQVLTFEYISPGTPLEIFETDLKLYSRSRLIPFKQPIFDTADQITIEKSLKKKSNKSRLNRLKKLGAINFKRIDDYTTFETTLDPIIEVYNQQQQYKDSTLRFTTDPYKKAFHLNLMQHQNLLHTTVLDVNGEVASAHIGLHDTNYLHLGIFTYHPKFNPYSTGKFHLLFLSQALANENIKYFDLTPGGDWKDRFANNFQTVYKLEVYPSKLQAQYQKSKFKLRKLAKQTLTACGMKF